MVCCLQSKWKVHQLLIKGNTCSFWHVGQQVHVSETNNVEFLLIVEHFLALTSAKPWLPSFLWMIVTSSQTNVE